MYLLSAWIRFCSVIFLVWRYCCLFSCSSTFSPVISAIVAVFVTSVVAISVQGRLVCMLLLSIKRFRNKCTVSTKKCFFLRSELKGSRIIILHNKERISKNERQKRQHLAIVCIWFLLFSFLVPVKHACVSHTFCSPIRIPWAMDNAVPSYTTQKFNQKSEIYFPIIRKRDTWKSENTMYQTQRYQITNNWIIMRIVWIHQTRIRERQRQNKTETQYIKYFQSVQK